jgi:7-carboxy-7-deazaguanine synthase
MTTNEVGDRLPVNETFTTIQGEATWTGRPPIFIRLQGCTVGCPWCDTKHTWRLDEASRVEVQEALTKPQSGTAAWALASVDDLIRRCRDARPISHVVITGGEPCAYDLRPLTGMLLAGGFSVQVETSGTYPVLVTPGTWVTLSPKVDMPGGRMVLTQAISRADEIKHPVGKEADLDALAEILARRRGALSPPCPVWLQPLSLSPKATAFAAEACKANGSWRLSIQGHALAGIR